MSTTTYKSQLKLCSLVGAILTITSLTACNQQDSSQTSQTGSFQHSKTFDIKAIRATDTEVLLPLVAFSNNPNNAPKAVREHIDERYHSLKTHSKDAQYWGLYGNALAANLFYDAAVPVYSMAHQLAPTDPQWASMVAISLAKTDKLEQALDYIESARQLASNDIAIVFYQASLYESIGDNTQALEGYKNAHRLAPTLAETNFALGRSLFNQGLHAESRPYLLTAMEKAPNSSLVRAFLVRLAKTETTSFTIPSEANTQNNAIVALPPPYYEKLLSESRQLSGIRNYIQSQQASSNTIAVINSLSLLISLYPDSVEEQEWLTLGHNQAIQNKNAEAISTYQHALHYFPLSNKLHLGLADLEFLNRASINAQPHYEQVLQQSPSPRDSARALQGLARIQAGRGQLKEALQGMLKASKQWPENPVIHMDLVRIYADLKDFAQVQQHLTLAERNGFNVPVAFRQQLSAAEQQIVKSQ